MLFIRNTIASLSLDKSNYRVLIVLNGDIAKESFENEINEIFKKNQYENFELISFKNCNSLSQALNHGLSHINTEFVARIDDDDLILKNRFHIQLEEIKQRKLDFLSSNYLSFNEFGKVTIHRTSKSNLFVKDFLYQNAVCAPCSIIRTSCLKAINGYNEKLNYGEDWDLGYRIAKNGYRIGISQNFSIAYRVHSGQLSQSSYLNKIKNLYKIFRFRYKNPFYIFYFFSVHLIIRTSSFLK